MVNASISDKNIFGSGLNLGFSIDYSKRRSDFSLNLTNPAIRDSKYSGTIQAYSDESEITTTTLASGTETLKEMGLLVGVGKGIGRHTRAGINYQISDSDVSYELNSGLNDSYITSAITPYINYNNTDDYYMPREGISTGASVKYAGLGGDAEYVESSLFFKYYYGLEDILDYDVIFRYKNQFKLLTDNGYVPVGKSFYMGGPKNLRGYESYAFQPSSSTTPLDQMFVNSIELSFPLLPSAKMRWALFYDYGMIKGDGTTLDTNGNVIDEDYKRSGAGALISWNSPVGPIQFIFSQALDDEPGDRTSSFEFNMGSQF
jgi:outer membrane protein insertion porin family